MPVLSWVPLVDSALAREFHRHHAFPTVTLVPVISAPANRTVANADGSSDTIAEIDVLLALQ